MRFEQVPKLPVMRFGKAEVHIVEMLCRRQCAEVRVASNWTNDGILTLRWTF